MLYIVTALKSEAQAFVEKYSLTKTSSDGYTIFENENFRVIVSGVGVESAKKAATFLLKKFSHSSEDRFINVGICGANKRYKIGALLNIGSIIYRGTNYTINRNSLHSITCANEEISKDQYEIVDMESFGFYEALKEKQNCFVFKVVSDHFEPSKVTKDGTKKLILNVVDEIIKEVTR